MTQMENLICLWVSLYLFLLPHLGNTLSDCSGSCKTNDDCSGRLICISNICNDDPDSKTTICKGSGISSSSPAPSNDVVSDCYSPCKTQDDCSGQLICVTGKCNDDTDVGTNICKGEKAISPSPAPSNDDVSDCFSKCKTLDDCPGQLICIDDKCNDDPEVGTTICKGGGISPSLSPPNDAVSECFGPCKTGDDCLGELICINATCNDDPEVGTTNCDGIIKSTPSQKQTPTCSPAGNIACNGSTFSTYKCSPQVTATTTARLTLTTFSRIGPTKCYSAYHSDTDYAVALSTGWYDGGSRCGKTIRIRASNGRSVTAKVVDECDSMSGCDAFHAGLGPCRNNVVDGSPAVSNSLGLNQTVGMVNVTWSMADLIVCQQRRYVSANLVVCLMRRI